jgi:hypothetical protein
MTATTTIGALDRPAGAFAPAGIEAQDWCDALVQLGWTPPGQAPATTASVAVTASDATGPLEARCHTCATNWTRTPRNTAGDGLGAWLRAHPCTPDVPPALDVLGGPAAALVAAGLLGVSLELVARAVAASRTQNHLAGTGNERAFWQAVGRQDGLIEAERYLLRVIKALDQQGSGRP